MDFEEVVYKRRTIRRFKQEPIELDILKKLIDYARVAPVASNIQALEYIIVVKKDVCNELFKHLRWAGALPPEMRTPEENRRPVAYIIVLLNKDIKKGADHDVGAAVENILLGATNFGIGACWMGAIDREKIRELLKIPKNYEIKHVISLGFPDEESIIEKYNDSFKYWKDEAGRMHVPKRSLDEIIYKIEK
ncbi:MAG: nitroreductase family protein [Promethearchaeota archaeon]